MSSPAEANSNQLIMAINPDSLIPPAVVSFVVWRAYVRCRRNIGRQPLQPKRMIMRIIIFGVATLVVGVASLLHVPSLIGLGIGLLLAVPLAFWGLHLTRFETTPEGHFYTPNTYIGVALSILFFARLAYRGIVLYNHSPTLFHTQSPAFMQSPLTTFIFGLLASYTIAYNIGVLLRSYD